jgi:antitoxin HicB
MPYAICMRAYRYIPITRSAKGGGMPTYVFRVELIEEEDGRWSAGVPVLPGCATWGYTREEALKNIHDAVEAYIRDVQKAGEEIPKDTTIEVIIEPAVAVTV